MTLDGDGWWCCKAAFGWPVEELKGGGLLVIGSREPGIQKWFARRMDNLQWCRNADHATCAQRICHMDAEDVE